MENRDVTIIGTGALGSVLARALAAENFSIAGLYNRSEDAFTSLKKEVKPVDTGTFPKRFSALGSVVFITVADNEIDEVAGELANLSDDFSACTVIHCSGTKTSAELCSLKEKGASVASFHPLQTFTPSSKPEDLSAIYFDVEGDSKAVQFLENLAQQLGSQVLHIDKKAKPYLHAAAVMSSNYLLALLDASSTIAEAGGLNNVEAQKALLPLVRQTLKNSENVEELSKVLSGPIARGDIATVQEHLALLEQNPEALALYKQLGLVAVQLAKAGEKISESQEHRLVQLFNN